MPGSADKLLDLLQERKLLPQFTIDSLRRQVSAAEVELSAHQVARLLQRKGKITAFQARELLAEVDERAAEEEAPDPKDDDLSLAPDDEAEKKQRRFGKSPAASSTVKPKKSDVIDAGDALAPLDQTPAIPAGLDDLLDDPLVTADAGAVNPLMPAPRPKKGWFGGKQTPSYAKKSRAGWDSPLIIMGGGILLLLILIGGTLTFVLSRGSGDELFSTAEKSYLEGKYAEAVADYQRFSAGHGSHPKASLARVRAALAQIRSSTSQHDWQPALATAQKVLPGIEGEAALNDARPELAGLLIDIVAGLAEQAAHAPDDEQASQSVEWFGQGMELVQQPVYSPGEVRQSQSTRLEAAQQQIDVVVRNLQQSARLTEDVAAMLAAVDAGEVARAYQIHADLIKLYPRLDSNTQLQSAVRAITGKLAKLVVVTDEVIASRAEDHPTPLAAEIALASPQGEAIKGVEGHVVPVVVDGVLYVLSAEDGKLLWRRFVGRESETVAAVDDRPGADLLVADTQRQELLRLAVADGKLVWRLPIGEPFVFSVRSPKSIYVTTPAGRVLEIDGESGQCGRQIRFPQRLAAAVAVDAENDLLVQLGEHSNVYVLDRKSLACRRVHYLEHKAGTIEHNPIAIAGLLVTPHNVGLARSQLRLLRLTDGEAAGAELASVALPGRIAAELLVGERRIFTVNDRGAIRIFGIDLAAEKPLELVGETTGTLQGDAAFPALAGKGLILAERKLTAYDLPAADGPPTPRWVKHKGDRFIAPPRAIGPYVFHVRRREGQAGVTVAAAAYDPPQAAKGGEPIWQTIIAPAAPDQSLRSSPDGTSVTAYCASGHVFTVGLGAGGMSALNSPVAAPETPGRFDVCLNLSETRRLLVEGDGDHRMLIDDAVGSPRLAEAKIGEPVKQIEARPAPWRGGLLLPLSTGQVEFWSDRSSRAPIYPFQPKLVVGEEIGWLRPLAIDENQVVLAREGGQVFLAQIDEQGAPHLAATAANQMDQPIASDPIALGQRVVVVCRDDISDNLWTMGLPQLDVGQPIALAGRLRWGPCAAGDIVLLSTQPGGLAAYASSGELRWTADLNGELPCGRPIVDGDAFILATTSGRVVRLRQEDGEIQQQFDVEQPLADGPLLVDGRFVVRTADGAVLIIKDEPTP